MCTNTFEFNLYRWAFEQAGVLGGTVSLFLVAYIAYETARVLLMAQRALFKRHGKILSYPDIASEILQSSNWGSFVRTATIVSCIGGCCGYMIFLGQVGGRLNIDIIHTYLYM